MKKEWQDFFDDPGLPLKSEEDQKLAELFHQVEKIDSPDPGTDYWNNFNSRLQSRLASATQKKKAVSFRFRWAWVSVGFSFLFVLAVFEFSHYSRDPGMEKSLENLSTDDLLVLEEVYEIDDNIALSDSLEWIDSETLDEVYYDSDDFYSDINTVDPKTLQTILKKDG